MFLDSVLFYGWNNKYKWTLGNNNNKYNNNNKLNHNNNNNNKLNNNNNNKCFYIKLIFYWDIL